MRCPSSPPMRRHSSLTWSPHAGVNHTARQPGLGNNCVISPALSGDQPSLPEVTPGGNHRVGPPPSEGKIPWPTDLPQRPSRPQIMSVFEGGGLVGWKARGLEELSVAGATPGGVYTVLLSHSQRGVSTSGTGSVGLRAVSPHNNNGKHNLGFIRGGLSQSLSPHPTHLTGVTSQASILCFVSQTKRQDQRSEQWLSQGPRTKKQQSQKTRILWTSQGLQPVPQVRHPGPPLGRNSVHGQWQ